MSTLSNPRSARIGLALCLLNAAGLIASTAQAAAGRTAGQAQVSANGVAQYSIPLWIPPGTKGLQPSLGLSYASTSGNGLAGMGFSLSGLSSITRCNRTIGQDGVASAVTLQATDALCLDGERLHAWGIPSYHYRTAVESFRRVTPLGSAGNGAASFRMESPDGLIYEYGGTEDSRIEVYGGATVHTWALNRIRDRDGNYIDFVYAEDTANSTYRPIEIRWTGNSTLSVAPTHRVKIVYEGVTRPDVLHGYRYGDSATAVNGLIQEGKRIDRIDVVYEPAGQGATLLRRYELTYEVAGGAGARTRLQSLQECAGATGTDCLAPTVFSWIDGAPGWGSETSAAGSVPAGVEPRVMDLNADGRDDLAWSSQVGSGSGYWHFMLADPVSGGFGGPQNSGVANLQHSRAFVIEWDGDGREDLIVPYNGLTWWVLRATGTGFAAPLDTGVSASGDFWFADVNADGRDDLVRAVGQQCTSGPESTTIYLRMNTGGALGAETFATNLADACPHSSFPFGHPSDKARSGTRRPDFNGDAREDLVIKLATYEAGRPTSSQTGAQLILSDAATGLTPGPQLSVPATNFRWGDVNGDGLTDFGYDLGLTFHLLYSEGLRFGATLTLPLSGYTMNTGLLTDWDHDGLDDYVVRKQTPSTWWVARAQRNESFAALTDLGLAAGNPVPAVADVNGDGLDDLAITDGTAGTIKQRRHQRPQADDPDLLDRVTDGFGNMADFDYAPLTDTPMYSPLAGAVYPTRAYAGHRYAVKRYRYSDGIGGLGELEYAYAGAREDLSGRGFLGFIQRTVSDRVSGRVTQEQYHQHGPDFDWLGRPLSIQVRQSASGPLVQETTYSWARHELGVASRRLPYLSRRVVKDYEVGGTFNGALIRTTTTVNTVDADSGATVESTTTTVEATSANGVQAGATYVQRVRQPAAELMNDTANWCLGRPGRIEETGSHDQGGGMEITRVTTLTWDAAKCRPTEVILAPGDALQLTRTLAYDDFGNLRLQTLGGSGMSRTTLTQWGSDGRFASTLTNALNQSVTQGWDAALGVPRSLTDANGISTTWSYDAYGRRTREARADGTATTWSYSECGAGCVGTQNKLIVSEVEWDANAAVITERRVYTDRLDRPITTSARMLSGAYNRVQTEYDAQGRVSRVSAPCWWDACTAHWTTFEYDLLNRVKQRSRPLSDSNPTPTMSAFFYEGLTTREVDALGKQRTRVANVLGGTARSADPSGYYQQFERDGFGQVLGVQDSLGATLLRNTYNARGMRTSQSDRAAGSWQYTLNAYAQIVVQQDAKLQSTSFQYDALGRLIQRNDADGISTWTWGSSAADRNIGQLAALAAAGYAEQYTYGALGRVLRRTISSDATYEFEYGYNPQGTLATLTYPVSTSNYRLQLAYAYQNGHLLQVRDANTPTVFWQANATDARGQLIDEQLGNGVQTVRGYDAVSGLPDFLQSGLGGAIQSYAYEWDAVGNLRQRQDVRQGLSESFAYDDLHRLVSVTGPEPMSLAYDARGNLLSQSGEVRPGASHTVSWRSDNLPQLIQGPSGYRSEFFYTPERSRWKQQASYGGTSETTVYLGGLLEKVTLGTTTAWKHAIQGVEGTVALYTRKSTGTNEVHYLTRDHLGSVTAVTDASGGVETRLSYAAYGRRRNEASWSGTPSGGEWSGITNTTRHGYTGHEMLDNLDLTHMNGRVYDPRVGRFISADPYIDGALNTQGWNRYAYVKNNPLSAYDPSGFGQEDAGGDCNSSSEAQISNPGDCSAGTTGGSAPSDTFEEVVVHSSRIWDGGGSIETVTVSASRDWGLNPLPIDAHAGSSISQVAGHGGGGPGGGAPAGTPQSDECYQPFTPGDSFASAYFSRLGNLIAGLADSVSGAIDLGPQLSGTVNFFGIKPTFTAGVFNGNFSLTGAGNLTLSVKSPTPGNLAYGEASFTLGPVKLGAASASVTEGISTRYGSFQQINQGFSGMAKAAWKSDAGKISAHFQVGVGAKLEWDVGAALRALGCATAP